VNIEKQNLLIFSKLNGFDIFIIMFFIILFLLLPRIMIKESKNCDQNYILMGRQLTFPLFVATLTSTWYGGVFGVAQIAFEQGLYSFFTQGLFWYFAYFIFAIFLAKKIRQKKILSLPELIGQKFGAKARKWAAIILFLHALPITYAISVGILLQITLAIDFFWALILGVTLVAAYSFYGGFKSIVLTDCLQFILMFTSTLIAVIACIINFGGPLVLSNMLPPHYFIWQGQNSLSSSLVWLFIALSTTLIHPVFYQRCLAAISDKVAVFGIFMAMAFWLLFDICITFLGMYARAFFPNFDSQTAFLSLGIYVLPHGLKGLFLSGILATILSTLDSFLFISGISISYDLIKKNSVNNHRLAVCGCSIMVIIFALFFGVDFESTWLFLEGAFSSSLLVPVLACLCLKRNFSSPHFLIPSFFAGVSFFIATCFFQQNIIHIQPFYIAHLVALVFFFVVLKFHSPRNSKMALFTNN
jgi:solute:Na+ symporter, SSS family